MITLSVALVGCALAITTWCANSFGEYTGCRAAVLASVDETFSLDGDAPRRLEAIVSRYAEEKQLGNFLAVLMRNECGLEPTSYRDSAEHRLLWSALLRTENSQTIVRLVLARTSAIVRPPPTQQGRIDLQDLTDDQLECLVQHTLHLRSREQCEPVRL